MTKTKPTIIETHQVPELSAKQRLQDYAVGVFRTLPSRKGTKKAIKSGRICINGAQGFTGDWIRGGEELTLYEPKISKKPSIDVPLTVLFEDDHLAIIHKPAGVLVSGNKRFTIENALSFNLKKSQEPDALLRPEPIHRLDYPTTGALLIGKTAKAVMLLNTLFEERKVEKTYLAVTIGAMDDKGVIEEPIDSKPSRSTFKKIASVPSERFEALNLLELVPHTGRRHQLRKHLSFLGNSILGDPLYSKEGLLLKGKGLYLHAYLLAFVHPVTHATIRIKAPIPKKFEKLFPESLVN